MFRDVTAKAGNRGGRASLIRGGEVAPVFEVQVRRDLGRVNQIAIQNRQMAALTLACHRSGGWRDWGLNPARGARRGCRLSFAAIEGEFGAAVAAESLADRTVRSTRRTASPKRRPAIGTKLLAFRVFCIALGTAHWFAAWPSMLQSLTERCAPLAALWVLNPRRSLGALFIGAPRSGAISN